MYRVEYYSIETFKKIPIGCVVKTKSGLYLPKIRYSPDHYRNIKDGCAQPTFEQAESVVK